MRKFPLAILAMILVLTISAQLVYTAPTRKSMRMHLNSDYLRAMSAYKRLESRLMPEDLRDLTTIGILNGAKETEKQMERNLVKIVKRLLQEAKSLSDDELIDKVKNIEKQLLRDHRALLILASAMDLVTGAKDEKYFKFEMQQTLQQISRQSNSVVDYENCGESRSPAIGSGEGNEAAERIAALRRQIVQQVRAMKTLVEEKVTQTLDYLIGEAEEGSLLAQASKKLVRKRNASEVSELPAEGRKIKSILTEQDFRDNLVDTEHEIRNNEIADNELNASVKTNKISSLKSSTKTDFQKQEINSTAPTTMRTARATTLNSLTKNGMNISTTTITPTYTTETNTKDTTSAKQQIEDGVLTKQQIEDGVLTKQQIEDGVLTEVIPIPIPVAPLQVEDNEFPDLSPPADGGGGGGLVGIITSLSGGEGGSDIGALIGALTGVISNLFGPGGLDIESLISTATSLISGLLSGNKNFGTVLGNYIGTAFDGLSGGGGAVNNGQFLGNLVGTIYASLSADPEDDDYRPNPFLFVRNFLSSFVEAKNRKESGEELDDERRSASQKNNGDIGGGGGGAGSDSGGFIKHIASHIVGSLVSLVLNASLGSSAGAAHASASLFGGSSHKSGAGGAGGWNGGGEKY